MELGLYLPNMTPAVTGPDVVRFAREAESRGFHSVWTYDHLFTPLELRSRYPYTSDGSYGIDPRHNILDPVGVLGVIAGATERIALGSAVIVPAYRHPIPLAKCLATVDTLSGGRLILGLAVGWMEEEFRAVGISPKRKGARFDEHVRAMRAIWENETSEFHGEFYEWEPASFLPRPPRGTIPLLFGGHSDAALRRVARLGDGWAISSMLAGGGSLHERLRRVGMDYYEAGLARLRIACEEEGRAFGDLTNLVSRPIMVTDEVDTSDRPVLVGTPAQILDDMRCLAELGVSILNLVVYAKDVDAVLPALDVIAAKILPEAATLAAPQRT